MPPKSQRHQTIAEYLGRRVGVWKASQVLVLITAWWAEEELQGRRIDRVEDLVDAHWFSRSAAFRKLALFREAFEPLGLKDPHELAELLPEGTRSAVQVAQLAV